MKLSLRARLTWCAHLYKACVKQHHRELHPALAQLIRPDSVIMDVGAHAGQFAKLFAGLAPDGHVYAFEPGSYARSILRPALMINRARNITVVPCGLGDAQAEINLSIPIKSSGSVGFGLSHVGDNEAEEAQGSGDDAKYYRETVNILTLDEVVATHRIDRVDFIKADIEGWELRMLVGAQSTLVRDRPSLMIEVDDSHLVRAGDTTREVFEHLFGLGYRGYKLSADLQKFERVPAPEDGDFFFIAEDNPGFN